MRTCLGDEPSQVRVKWGAMHNFKCVDYFQVEYSQVDTMNLLLSVYTFVHFETPT